MFKPFRQHCHENVKSVKKYENLVRKKISGGLGKLLRGGQVAAISSLLLLAPNSGRNLVLRNVSAVGKCLSQLLEYTFPSAVVQPKDPTI